MTEFGVKFASGKWAEVKYLGNTNPAKNIHFD